MKMTLTEIRKHERMIDHMRQYGRALQVWLPGMPLVMNPVSPGEARYYRIKELRCNHWCSDSAADIANEAIERCCDEHFAPRHTKR